MNPQQLIRDLSQSSDPRLRRARHGLSKSKDDLKLKGDLCNNVSHIYAYVISLASLSSINFLRNSYHIIHLSLVIHLLITHALTLTPSHIHTDITIEQPARTEITKERFDGLNWI